MKKITYFSTFLLGLINNVVMEIFLMPKEEILVLHNSADTDTVTLPITLSFTLSIARAKFISQDAKTALGKAYL